MITFSPAALLELAQLLEANAVLLEDVILFHVTIPLEARRAQRDDLVRVNRETAGKLLYYCALARGETPIAPQGA